MRPAVLTAVLLLVDILNTGTVVHGADPVQKFCDMHIPDRPCGDGWSYTDDNHCAKYFKIPKNFTDSKEHCSTLNGDLVSIHNHSQTYQVLCLTIRTDSELKPFWIGAQRSGGNYTYTDRSEVDYFAWHPDLPNVTGQEGCIVSNFKDWGYWNQVICSEERNFVCIKKM